MVSKNLIHPIVYVTFVIYCIYAVSLFSCEIYSFLLGQVAPVELYIQTQIVNELVHPG